MHTVDLHQHLWPERLIRALERRREPPCLRGTVLHVPAEAPGDVDLAEHLPERRLARLDRDGIDVAVISPAPTCELDRHPDLRDAYHDGIREVAAASGGRLLALSAETCLPEFVGACVAAPVLVEGCDSLLGALRTAEQILFVHPGPPAAAPAGTPGWWPAVVDYTAQMQAAYAVWLARDAARFPDLRVVFAILAGGAPIQLERLRSRGGDLRPALSPNLYLDTSSYGRRALELAFSTFGATQVVFGSDVPVIDAAPTLEAVTGFGDGIADLVLRENPNRLLARLS
jgi:hypothetical protein